MENLRYTHTEKYYPSLKRKANYSMNDFEIMMLSLDHSLM